MIEKTALGTIAICRSLFYNTPLGNSRFATYIYKNIFKFVYREQDKKISYFDVELWVPTKDITIVPGLINGYYEKLELELFKTISQKSKVILDVGGNIGLYSLIAARHGSKNLKAYSFEPVPENISFLKRNIELNPSAKDKVEVEEVAIGNKSGKLTLNLSPITVGTHTACDLDVPGVSQIEVPVTTLDKFVKAKDITVDILKIDIEGYEGYALQGAAKLISSQKPTIFMEYLPSLMSRSDFALENMRKLLFDHYDHCFIVDEMAQTIREINTKDIALDSFSGNLVLTNKKSHTQYMQSVVSK